MDGFELVEEEEKSDKDTLVCQMTGLFNSIPIKIEEKGFLIQLMHNFQMRETLTDILNDFNHPQVVLKGYECMKLIADILRFVLTLFVHEQQIDFRLLYAILDVSQNVYFVGKKKRKIFLSTLLYDHGIWSDMRNWLDCIDFALRLKIDDAIARKKRRSEI